MKICPNCGKQLNDNVFFCSACGAKVGDGLNTSPEIDDEKTLSDVYPRTAPATNGITTPPPADIDDEKTLSDVYDKAKQTPPVAPVNPYETQQQAVYANNPGAYNANGFENGAAYAPQTPPENPPEQYQNPYYNQFNPQNGINPAVQAPEPKKKKKGKKGLVIGIIVAVVVLLAAAAAVFYFMFGKQEKAASPTFYVKDGELYVIKSLGKESETILITDDLAENQYAFTDDFKYVIYGANPKNSKGEDGATKFELCIKELMKEDAEETELDDNVTRIGKIVGEAEKIYYLKNDSVYCTDKAGKSDKIVSDITDVRFSTDDSRMLAYKSVDSKDKDSVITYVLYSVELNNNEKTELSSKATNYAHNDDLTKITYIEGDNLYLSENGKKAEKIASGVAGMNVAGENIYYTVKNKDYKLTDFVKDDYKNKDKDIKEPEWSDFAPDSEDYYPDSKDYEVDYDAYDDYDAYSDAYDAAAERYSKAYEEGSKKYEKAYAEAEKKYDEAVKKYDEAKDRINIREALDEYGVYSTDYALYLYNGKSTELLKNVASMYGSTIQDVGSEKDSENHSDYFFKYSDKIQVALFETELKNIKKYDMAELVADYSSYSSTPSCTDTMTSYLDDEIERTTGICSGEKVTKLDFSDKYTHANVVYDSGSSNYIVSCSIENNNTNSDEYVPSKYDIFSLKDTAADFKDAESLAKGVYMYNKIGEEYIAAEDYSSSSHSYDFEYKEEKIKDSSGLMCKVDGSDALYYFTDVDNDNFSGTLCKYENGESVEIADDVYLYNAFDVRDGKYIVIKDFEEDEGGDLVLIDGKEEYKIDKDVARIEHNHFTYSTNVCESYEG